MEEYREKGDAYERTRDGRELLGRRVLTKSGADIGKVREVRLDHDRQRLVGIAVGRGPLREPLYISMEYVSRFTEDAVLLGMDPAAMWKGRSVVSRDGKRLGRIVEIVRKDETEEIRTLRVRRLWRTYEIPVSAVKAFGRSLILEKEYDKAREDFAA